MSHRDIVSKLVGVFYAFEQEFVSLILAIKILAPLTAILVPVVMALAHLTTL